MYQIKRIYDPPAPEDGVRYLVDRLWPRGVSKKAAALDGWLKELTPSNDLRKEFHGTGNWADFEARYRDELQGAELTPVRAAAQEGQVTLLTATKDMQRNHVHVLLSVLMDE